MDRPDEELLRRFARLAMGEGLWVPGGRDGLPATVAPLIVVIDHIQLGLRTPSTHELLDLIRAIPLEAGVAWTSRVAMTVANMRQPLDQDQHLHLAAGLFSEEVFERIRRLVAANPDRIIFHRLQLLSLFRLLLNIDRPGAPGRALPQEEVLHMLGQAALAINAHMEGGVQARLEHAGSDEERRWRTIAFGVRNMAFHRGATSFDVLIGRSALLWKDLPGDRNFAPPYPMVIDDLFRAATGSPLDDYFAYGFLIALAYQDFSLLSDRPEARPFTIISRERPLTELDERYVELPRKVIDILTARTQSEDIARILENLYDVLGYRQRPLVHVGEDGRVPVDLVFLQEILTMGVFWIIDDYLGEVEGEAGSQRWRGFFGPLLEHYVRKLTASVIDAGAQVVRRVFGPSDWTVRPRRRGDVPHCPDVAVVYPDAIVFVEVISTRLHFLKTAIEGDPDRLKRDLEQMVYEPAVQLHGTISDFRDARIALQGVDSARVRTYPLIVVADVLPQFPPLWEEMLGELARRGVFMGQDRSRFEIWDLDEFELVMSILEDGAAPSANLAQFIDGKVGDVRSRAMPLRNYLIARDFHTRAPSYVWEARQRLLRRLAQIHEERRRPA